MNGSITANVTNCASTGEAGLSAVLLAALLPLLLSQLLVTQLQLHSCTPAIWKQHSMLRKRPHFLLCSIVLLSACGGVAA